MPRTTTAKGNGRSVIPLSLALLVFNVLGSDETPRSLDPAPAAEESVDGTPLPDPPPRVA